MNTLLLWTTTNVFGTTDGFCTDSVKRCSYFCRRSLRKWFFMRQFDVATCFQSWSDLMDTTETTSSIIELNHLRSDGSRHKLDCFCESVLLFSENFFSVWASVLRRETTSHESQPGNSWQERWRVFSFSSFQTKVKERSSFNSSLSRAVFTLKCIIVKLCVSP